MNEKCFCHRPIDKAPFPPKSSFLRTQTKAEGFAGRLWLFSDSQVEGSSCRTARQARCSRTSAWCTTISRAQQLSHRRPKSRPSLTARPAPGPAPSEDSRFCAPRLLQGPPAPTHLKERPRTPRPPRTPPLHGPASRPPVARCHPHTRAMAASTRGTADEGLQDLPPRRHRKQPHLHGSPLAVPWLSLTLHLIWGPVRWGASGGNDSRRKAPDRLCRSCGGRVWATVGMRSNGHVLQGACAATSMRTDPVPASPCGVQLPGPQSRESPGPTLVGNSSSRCLCSSPSDLSHDS